MVIWPGVNAVTVPTATAPVVICVVAGVIAGCVVVTCRVLVVLVCANAKGATIAQARTIVVRLMCPSFVELTFLVVSGRAFLSDVSISPIVEH